MNIEKGGKRLVTTISWLVAILFWIGWAILYRDVPVVWMGVGVVFGLFAGAICSGIGLWILNGFMDDQNDIY